MFWSLKGLAWSWCGFHVADMLEIVSTSKSIVTRTRRSPSSSDAEVLPTSRSCQPRGPSGSSSKGSSHASRKYPGKFSLFGSSISWVKTCFTWTSVFFSKLRLTCSFFFLLQIYLFWKFSSWNFHTWKFPRLSGYPSRKINALVCLFSTQHKILSTRKFP